MIDNIFCEDCLVGMKKMPAGSVDLVVADPPYELIQHGRGKAVLGHRQYHKDIKHLQTGVNEEMLSEMMRVCKLPNIYLFCSKEQLYKILPWAIDNGLKYDLLTWHKTNPIPTCYNKYLSDTEYIVFMRSGAELYGTYESKRKYFITPTNTEDKRLYGHPTPKPVKIIKTLIENSTKEGGVVLDPFMGSGTTAIAAMRSNRHYIGFELDKGYYDAACKRIEEEKSNLTLNFHD